MPCLIIWTNNNILSIKQTKEILFEIQKFSFKKMHLKMLAILSRPQCINNSVSAYKSCYNYATVSWVIVGWDND